MAEIAHSEAALPVLTAPLRDLAAWTSYFLSAEIPVLADTAHTLEVLRTNEDAVDANLLGETMASDPLMSLKVLAHLGTHRPERLVTDAETVTAALVVMGITPFFAAFGPQPSVEERLAPPALAGLQQVLRRSRRAARFALGFAVSRMDHDAAILHEAALLHGLAEMLLWCHAPGLALEMARRQAADPALRSAAVQRAVLNIELNDLQLALMRAWRLPELLIRISDGQHAQSPQERNVLLAIRLARHSAAGWDNPALPDDLRDIGQLLNLGPEPTRHLVVELDA